MEPKLPLRAPGGHRHHPAQRPNILASLVDDVLALSQMEAERMTLTKEWGLPFQEIVGHRRFWRVRPPV